MTGCLRIVKQSIFTGLNNFSCFDVANPMHAGAFGFTEEEVDRLLRDAGLSDRKDKTPDWYDGCRFGNGREVCCPWDITLHVLSLMKSRDAPPQAYWKDSAENDIMRQLVRGRRPQIEDRPASLRAGGCVTTRVANAVSCHGLTDTDDTFLDPALPYGLSHEGHGREGAGAGPSYRTGGRPPSSSPTGNSPKFLMVKSSVFFNEIVATVDGTKLFGAFREGNADGFQLKLSRIVGASVSVYDCLEHFHHAFLGGLFAPSHATVSNLESGGRSGLLIRHRAMNSGAVVEVKRTSNPREPSGLPDMALSQIAEKGYDAKLRSAGGERMLHRGVGFRGRDCAVKVGDVSACLRSDKS